MRSLLVILILLASVHALPAFSATTEPRCVQDDAGSGRDAAWPEDVAVGPGTWTGCTDARDWEDYFYYVAAEDTRVRIVFESAACMGESGDWYIDDDQYETAPDVCGSAHLDHALAAGERLSIGFFSYASQVVPYTITLLVGDQLEGTCEGGDLEAGRDASAAAPLTLAEGVNEACIASFERTPEDTFTFTVGAGEFFTLTLQPVDCTHRFHAEIEIGDSKARLVDTECGYSSRTYSQHSPEATTGTIRVMRADYEVYAGPESYTLTYSTCQATSVPSMRTGVQGFIYRTACTVREQLE